MDECRFPLWHCLPAHVQAKLTDYQMHRHKRKLRPPGVPALEEETLEEVARIMKETGKEIKL